MFEPLPEEEVNRRKEAEDEKTRVKMEKLMKKQEKKQKQAGMEQASFIVSLKSNTVDVLMIYS